MLREGEMPDPGTPKRMVVTRSGGNLSEYGGKTTLGRAQRINLRGRGVFPDSVTHYASGEVRRRGVVEHIESEQKRKKQGRAAIFEKYKKVCKARADH